MSNANEMGAKAITRTSVKWGWKRGL